MNSKHFYKVDFAPDGINYHTIKKGNFNKIWDYFVFDNDLRQQIAINPYAKFRLTGVLHLLNGDVVETVIGTLPRKN